MWDLKLHYWGFTLNKKITKQLSKVNFNFHREKKSHGSTNFEVSLHRTNVQSFSVERIEIEFLFSSSKLIEFFFFTVFVLLIV